MSLNLNFADKYKVLPPGNYPVVIESAEVVFAKNPQPDGSPAYNLKMEFRVMDGPQEDETITQWASLVEKNLWSLRNTLINVGVPLHDMMDEEGNVSIETDAEDMEEDPRGVLLEPEIVGRTGIAVITAGTFNGKPSANISKVLDDTGVDREKAMRDERKANGSTPSRPEPSARATQIPAAPVGAVNNGASPRKNLTLRRTT